jgi:hypothetical protein
MVQLDSADSGQSTKKEVKEILYLSYDGRKGASVSRHAECHAFMTPAVTVPGPVRMIDGLR